MRACVAELADKLHLPPGMSLPSYDWIRLAAESRARALPMGDLARDRSVSRLCWAESALAVATLSILGLLAFA